MGEAWDAVAREILGVFQGAGADLWSRFKDEDKAVFQEIAADYAKQAALMAFAATDDERDRHRENLRALVGRSAARAERVELRLVEKGREVLPKVVEALGTFLLKVPIKINF